MIFVSDSYENDSITVLLLPVLTVNLHFHSSYNEQLNFLIEFRHLDVITLYVTFMAYAQSRWNWIQSLILRKFVFICKSAPLMMIINQLKHIVVCGK
jgi:hypothetical protein